MTAIAHICERWSMKLEPSDPSHPWFADWVLRSPREAGVHLSAGWHALVSLQEVYEPKNIQTVREYFGGIGAQALMVHELFGPFTPYDHRVMDYSQDAVAHMERELPPIAAFSQADAYDPSSCFPADLVALDFGDFTVWRTRESEPHRKLLDRVFAHRPKAVLLTDIACRYLHLHRERYEGLLGVGSCVSYDRYLEALVDLLEEMYSYTLVAGYTHRWSTVMALVPDVLIQRGEFHPVPESPVGLELL